MDTKADISVVTRKQIENLHLQTVEDTLREVPGTQFLNYGSNGLNANLSGIRINGSKDVVILVDGVRITDFQGANNSGYMYASILNNMDNIERVEVLRGSAAVKYGSGAKGGVINIITRKLMVQNRASTFLKALVEENLINLIPWASRENLDITLIIIGHLLEIQRW